MEEHADITEARSYMQRGLRFCKGSTSLWLESTKLELHYIAKVTARRQMLGIDENSASQRPGQVLDDANSETANLPRPVAEDIHASGSFTDELDKPSLQKLANTPALSGAIPIAIFDAAMVHARDDDQFAQHFFDAVEEVNSIPCLRSILKHIVDHMRKSRPSSWRTLVCHVKISCVGIAVTSPEFPKAFGISLKRLQGAFSGPRRNRGLFDSMQTWLGIFLDNGSLDAALRQIMLSTLGQLHAAAESSHAGNGVEG